MDGSGAFGQMSFLVGPGRERPTLVTEANPTTQPEGRKAAGRPDARFCLASWPPPPAHSSRSTTAGSTRVARSAGIRLAASAARPSRPATRAKVAGSVALTP